MRERVLFYRSKVWVKFARSPLVSLSPTKMVYRIFCLIVCVIRFFSDGGRIGSYFTYLNREKKSGRFTVSICWEWGVSSLCMSVACPVNINIYIKIVITFCVLLKHAKLHSVTIFLCVVFSYSFKKHQNALSTARSLFTYLSTVICVISYEGTRRKFTIPPRSVAWGWRCSSRSPSLT